MNWKKTGAMLVVVLVAVLFWYWHRTSRRKPAAPKQERVSEPQRTGYHGRTEEDETQRPSVPPAPSAEDTGDATPRVQRVYVEGKGWARVVVNPKGQAPPRMEDLPEAQEKPRQESMLPVTPEWKLKMTKRLAKDMDKRVDRLQEALEAARRTGDDAEVHRLEILLKRTKMRLERLHADIQTLKDQVEQHQGQQQGDRGSSSSGQQGRQPAGQSGTSSAQGAPVPSRSSENGPEEQGAQSPTGGEP